MSKKKRIRALSRTDADAGREIRDDGAALLKARLLNDVLLHVNGICSSGTDNERSSEQWMLPVYSTDSC